MASILPIARMGNPILKRAADPVDFDQRKSLEALVANMIATLDAQNERIGLAAPQVFISQRVVIYRIPARSHQRYAQDTLDAVPLTVLCNPVITPLSDIREEGWEACISIPKLMGKVPRYTHIRCDFFSIDGVSHMIEATGFHARVLQHECDHLDGILYPHQMTDLSTLGFEDEIVSKNANIELDIV